MNHLLFQVFTRPPSKAETLYQGSTSCFVCLFVLVLVCFLTHFEKPSFPVRVKEGQCEVVPVVLGDFEGLAADASVQFLDLYRETEGKKNSSNKN